MYDVKKLKAQMTLKGITQEELAKMLGINESTLNQKVNCKRDWNLSEVIKLQKILGKSEVISIFFD